MPALRGEFDGFVVGFFEEDFEGFDAGGVEGGVEVAGEYVHDLFFGEVLAVGAFGGEGFEHVGGGEDADFGGEFGGVEAAVVAGAVEAFVVGGGDGGEFAEAGDAFEDLAGVEGVFAHEGEFVGVEFAGLVEDEVGDAELADVVEACGAAEEAGVFGGEAHDFGDAGGDVGDALAVAVGPGTLGVDHLAEADGDAVEQFFGDGEACFFGLEGHGFLERV